MISISFKFDIGPWNKFADKLAKEPMDVTCRKQVAFRYLAFCKERFTKQGNGSWPPLAESTIAKRRQNSDVPLRDTGLLLNALDMGAKGNFVGPIEGGVRVGFAETPHSNGKSFRDIAAIHDSGQGVPKRAILVEPDEKTSQDILSYLKKRVERLTG
jgi:hypothetical protein